MEPLDNYLEIAVQSAKDAGIYLLAHFGKDHDEFYKSEFDVGLPVDKESEEIILARIRDAFPTHNIYSEELGEIKNESDLTWYIDPLDGTNNYFTGIPYFGVSIALVKNCEVIIGVVYNPITEQLFTAIKGQGAFLNNKQIERKLKNKSKYSVLAFIKGHSKSDTKISDMRAKEVEYVLSENFTRVLKMWAPSLDWCLLALGDINALVSYESELEDMFAGLLIAQEAGVIVCSFDGTTYKPGNKRIFASNKNLIVNITELMKRFSE